MLLTLQEFQISFLNKFISQTGIGPGYFQLSLSLFLSQSQKGKTGGLYSSSSSSSSWMLK
jgi:hypothetical protein